MIQCGSSPGFLHEATHGLAACVIARQNLQSDFAIELGVVGEVDLTHSARAELRADFVAANFCARVNWQDVIWGILSGVFSKCDHSRLVACATPPITNHVEKGARRDVESSAVAEMSEIVLSAKGGGASAKRAAPEPRVNN